MASTQPLKTMLASNMCGGKGTGCVSSGSFWKGLPSPQEQRGWGQSPSALCLCFLLPKSPLPPSALVTAGRQGLSVRKASGLSLWSGWEAGSHHPGFLFSLPVWGSCSQCGAWQGWGGCREGLNRDILCTPDSPGSVCLTPQSLLPGMAYASHMGPAGDREALGHSPGRTGRLLARAGLKPGKMDVDGSGWCWGRGRPGSR